jgi:hypothetical protein
MTTIRKFRNRYNEVAYIRANFADASSTIEISWGRPDAWQSTPHQVADARHRPANALRLALGYLANR